MGVKLAIGAFVTMTLLAFVVIFGYQFGWQALGSTDMGVNLSGTQYAKAYNSSVNTSVAAMGFVGFEGILIGAVALVFMLLILMVAVNKSGY